MEQGNAMVDILALPEGCISHILSLTSPTDAFRSSVISSIFRSAAESDTVWHRLMPCNYQEIISRSDVPVVFSTKKDLYLLLCDFPIVFDGGTKSFGLDRMSGKICYMLGVKALSVAHEMYKEHWFWQPLPWSRFGGAAKIVDTRPLKITGRMGTQQLSPNTSYSVYFVYQASTLYESFYNLPIKVSVRHLKEGRVPGDGAADDGRTVYLLPPKNLLEGRYERDLLPWEFLAFNVGVWWQSLLASWGLALPLDKPQLRRDRGDNWLEIEMGEFFNAQDSDHDELEMVVELGRFNFGVTINGFELRPKKQACHPINELKDFCLQ